VERNVVRVVLVLIVEDGVTVLTVKEVTVEVAGKTTVLNVVEVDESSVVRIVVFLIEVEVALNVLVLRVIIVAGFVLVVVDVTVEAWP